MTFCVLQYFSISIRVLLDFNDGPCCTQVKWVGYWYLCAPNQINHSKKIVCSASGQPRAGFGGVASVAHPETNAGGGGSSSWRAKIWVGSHPAVLWGGQFQLIQHWERGRLWGKRGISRDVPRVEKSFKGGSWGQCLTSVPAQDVCAKEI